MLRIIKREFQKALASQGTGPPRTINKAAGALKVSNNCSHTQGRGILREANTACAALQRFHVALLNQTLHRLLQMAERDIENLGYARRFNPNARLGGGKVH